MQVSPRSNSIQVPWVPNNIEESTSVQLNDTELTHSKPPI